MQIKSSQKGFTIVELLIVIVVIGILAAIVIVAFNGVQARANKTSAESAASQVVKKAEAYNAVRSSYPATIAAFAAEKESTLEGVTIAVPTSGTGKTTVSYQVCGTTGFRVVFWDYTASTPAVTTAATSLHGGSATSASTCTAAPAS